MLKKGVLALSVLVGIALVLVWFMPASLAMFWLAPRLHGVRLQQVGGLLWDGHADQVVTADGQPLGQLDWQLSRMALLGKPQLQIELSGPRLTFSGGMQKLPQGDIQWRDVHARVDLALLDPYAGKLAQGRPRGELRLNVEQALLQGGWPLTLQFDAQWSSASVKTLHDDIALGALQLQAQAQQGVVSAQLHDDGHGPLLADGQLQLSPLGWRMNLVLRARQPDPALRRWLAALGPVDANGTVHIQRNGGLAIGLPPPTPDRTPH